MDANYIYPDIDFLKHNEKEANQVNDGSNLVTFLAKMKASVKIAYTEATNISTLYALELAPGVRVSKITALQHEISVVLQASDIQFDIPIPGTSYLGIRAIKESVPQALLGDFLKNDSYLKSERFMEVILGRLYDGKPAYYDFSKFTHLLISGTTGSGKSIFIDSVLVNLLYKASPDELKLILIDTHALNLLRFNNISHLIFPVVTDVKKAAGSLEWAVAEMDYRYKCLSENGVKNIESYNELMINTFKKTMPRILVVIDDLADLMSGYSYPKALQEDLERLVSMSRAAGIHLLLSIQRPSSNVVSSAIKMNIANRIAFKTVSGGDSRLIINTNGAEQLSGNGDMLFIQLGRQEPVRLQGLFVSDEEIDCVVKFIIRNNSFYAFHNQVNNTPCDTLTTANTGTPPNIDNETSSGYDELLVEAGRFIIEKQKSSVGMIQRVFKIGFNRAARIMDQLAELGVVGPEEGTKPRIILMNIDEFEKFVKENDI